MAYASTLDVVRLTGIGVEVVDENVGTGDNSETDFDLDNDNVIASSYSLYYGASGSNSMTDLTETTHYTLDKDSGRILLTAAGVTELGTSVLYAKYIHSPKMSDTVINSFLDKADEEVDRLTGRYWGAATARTEFFDGRRTFKYPTTNEPYFRDWDQPDTVNVRGNVTEVSHVYFLSKGDTFSVVKSDDGGSFTDNTDEANSVAGTAFDVFASTPANADKIYFGNDLKFYGITSRLLPVGVDSGSTNIVWEYWNGTWNTITPSENVSSASDFMANGRITFAVDDMADWVTTAVDSSDSLYFLRAVATAADYSTAPKAVHFALDQDSVVSEEIPLSEIDWDGTGRITFVNKRIPDGNRVVKVIYREGESSTNVLITELASLLIGLRIYANITGGSYDDKTTFSLGRKSVSIGEVYVNVREVVTQFKNRIDDLVKRMGKKTSISVI